MRSQIFFTTGHTLTMAFSESGASPLPGSNKSSLSPFENPGTRQPDSQNQEAHEEAQESSKFPGLGVAITTNRPNPKVGTFYRGR